MFPMRLVFTTKSMQEAATYIRRWKQARGWSLVDYTDYTDGTMYLVIEAPHSR